MNRIQKMMSVTLAVALVLVSFSAALAAPAAQDLPPCVADPETHKISGTVTYVDQATGTVTLVTGGGVLCTVKITTDATHPIALLLGVYFGDLTSETFEQALADSQGCATTDGVTWTWADCTAPGAVPIKVTGINADGTYIAVKLADGTPITSVVVADLETKEKLNGALEDLLVDWVLEGDGDLAQVSDQVATLHEQGYGFGVLVKLFAIAQASGGTVTVEQLLEEVQAGAGMGELFKTYGKPDKTGVGHVRQEVNDQGNGNDKGQQPGYGNGNLPPGQEKKADQPPKGDKVKGVCKAVNKGNGNAKGRPACP